MMLAAVVSPRWSRSSVGCWREKMRVAQSAIDDEDKEAMQLAGVLL